MCVLGSIFWAPLCTHIFSWSSFVWLPPRWGSSAGRDQFAETTFAETKWHRPRCIQICLDDLRPVEKVCNSSNSSGTELEDLLEAAISYKGKGISVLDKNKEKKVVMIRYYYDCHHWCEHRKRYD